MEQLTPVVIFGIIAAYFLVLMAVSYWTGRNADNNDFFIANRQSPWYLVAFGMIGTSLSGVTFISIPGQVGAGGSNMAFSYMQIVFGYLLGYFVIATVLLPLYYRLKLISIYAYLEQRFGNNAYKTGAAYFLLSRTIGAAFRLYLVAIVFQTVSTLTGLHIPFWLTVLVTILLIWIYTFRGGMKTIVWTDTLQTLFMLVAVVMTIFAIGTALEKNTGELIQLIQQSDYSQLFFFEGGWSDPNNFFKQFISGALIAIVMTGLDQDMMQKNLSCRSLKEAQLNMFSFSIVLVFVNVLFLALGALLYIYANSIGLTIPEKTDLLYPILALEHLPPVAGIVFILGLIAAAYSSADSALTALTTSFCVDFLGFEKEDNQIENKDKTRLQVHIGFSVLLFFVIIIFNTLSDDSVINTLFKMAGYTYGPLLGLFTFGMLTDLKVSNKWVIPICIAAPILSYILNANDLFIGFKLGFLIILINGLLTFLGLFAVSYREDPEEEIF